MLFTIIVLFIYSCSVLTQSCPDNCYCDNDNSGFYKVNCQSQKFQLIPEFSQEVKVANFSQNSIEFVLNSTFTGKEKLLKVDLSGNRIFSLASGVFGGCVNLEDIDLRDNQLTFINSITFDGINVVIRDQNSTEKDFNQRELLGHSRKPVRIRFDGNPWHCNCALKKVWKKLEEIPWIEIDAVVCYTPEKYRNRQIEDISDICADQMSGHDIAIIVLAVLSVIVSVIVTIVDDVTSKRKPHDARDDVFVTDLDKTAHLNGHKMDKMNGVQLGTETEVSV